MGRSGRFSQPSAPAAAGGATDHGALTGLGDDDHPQYATDVDLSTHAGAADPHTGYQKESEKGAANGYAGLDSGGTVPDAQLPAALARDTEVTSAVATHAGLADPHTGYLLESAAAAVATSGSAADLATGTLPIARIADGAVTLAKFANLAQALVLGRASGAGTGVPSGLTAAELRTILALTGGLIADLPWDKTWSISGVPIVTTDATAKRWKNKTGRTITITAVCASAVTAPASTSLIFDLNKDGTTMYTTQGNRPALAVAANTVDATLPDVLTIADGSYLTMNVDQVGATVSDVTFQVFGKLG